MSITYIKLSELDTYGPPQLSSLFAFFVVITILFLVNIRRLLIGYIFYGYILYFSHIGVMVIVMALRDCGRHIYGYMGCSHTHIRP